jgi:predicted ATP-grasp superfamily ATP-dependent carboligase
MNRKTRIDQVRRKIDKRALMWFGPRATDSITLQEFSEFRGSFSIICPATPKDGVVDFCLENHKGRRVDVNRYDIDRDHSLEAGMMHERLLRFLVEPSVIVPYRPSAFIGAVWFPRQGSAAYWGMFHLKQAAFEYKPWVESCLSEKGIQTLPWRYYENGAISNFLREAGDDPVVLRINRGSGGAGVVLARVPSDVEKFCHDNEDGFFSATPYLEGAISLSIGAVVFPGGETFTDPLGFQLLGIPQCTHRPFGFCGTDFAAAKDLPDDCIDAVETMVRKTGQWLRQAGYLGVFGLDVLWVNGDLYLVEVNPRFIASSPLAARGAKMLGWSDLYIEHMAAMSGLSPLKPRPLREIVEEQASLSQIIFYNRSDVLLQRRGELAALPDMSIVELPERSTVVEPEGELFRLVVRGRATRDGYSLLPNLAEAAEGMVNTWITGDQQTPSATG